jgi:hypothetical protein
MEPESLYRHGRLRVRRSGLTDTTEVANILRMNGVPGQLSQEEAFLVAEAKGDILAVLAYRVEAQHLSLGIMAADPWADEAALASLLYAKARSLARELGLKEVRALANVYGDCPLAVGYRKRAGGWQLRTNRPLELRDELPEKGLRRLLALLSRAGAGVPFFSALEGSRDDLPL